MTLNELDAVIKAVKPVDQGVAQEARERLDNLTKPLGSLGKLEEIAWRLAAIQGRVKPTLGKKRIYTFAGDHGVTEEGISPYPKEVTPQMVMNFLAGGAAVNVLTRHVGAEISIVDVGVDFDFPPEATALVAKKVMKGTRNFAKGPAMTTDETLAAIGVGIAMANEAAAQGVTLLGAGEMGIGNTTSSAALLAVFGGVDPALCVGRGTGIDDEGLKRKARVITEAIALNKPNPADALDTLSKLGGLELAAMAGLYLGAAANGLPILADGFISGAAALSAVRLCPTVREYLFLSHLSHEAGHKKLVETLGMEPLLDFSMRLGEGTGAALAMSIVEASAKIISEMKTFEEAGVSNKEE